MQLEYLGDLSLRQLEIIVHLEHGAFLLAQCGDFLVEFRPQGEPRRVMTCAGRRWSGPITIRPAKAEDLALGAAAFTLGHVEQYLSKLVGGQAKEIRHGRRLSVFQRLEKPHPGLVDDAIQLVAAGQLRERAVQHSPRQPAQPLTRPFEQQPPGLAIPLVQPVEQTLKLNAAAFFHATILKNGPRPVRTDALDRLAR